MLLVTLLWTFVHHSSGAKILGLFVLNTKSHSLMINTILKELIARGHQVMFCQILAKHVNIFAYCLYTVGRGNSLPTAFKHAQLHGNRYFAGLQLHAGQ